MKKLIFTLILIQLFISLNSCRDKNIIENESTTYKYVIPEKIDDGWETDSVSSVNLDSNKLTQMVDDLNNDPDQKIHSILIVKDSKLVFEKYFKGYLFDTDSILTEGNLIQYDINTLHFMASVTKSVTSILLGIAIDNGYEFDVNKTLLQYYPKYAEILIGDKNKITLKHLLTMSAGFEWNELYYSYADPRNDALALYFSSDPMSYVLKKSLIYDPGERFSYNSGYTNIVADLIQEKINMPFLKYAEQKLFSSLKITDYKWDKINDSLVSASGGLYLSPRSLAKIGEVFLNNGKWNNVQIVSLDWIKTSTQSYINPNYYFFADGYGYQWWNYSFNTNEEKFNCFFAAGWGDQFLYIFPKLNMAIVITSGYFFDDIGISPHEIVRQYILSSIIE